MPKRILAALLLVLATVAAGPLPPAAAEEAVGPLPTPEDFVTQQYEDFLGRPPDGAGLAYWSALIRGGADPSSLVEAMATSDEFEGTVAPLVRLYFAFFDRPPDYDGLAYWIEQVHRGTTLQQVAQQFALSAEFRSTYGSLGDRAYVDLVYGNVLGRPADASGRAYWAGQLAGALDRGELMVGFSDSTEYRRIVGSRVRATMLYVGMLRRGPEGGGLDYWAGVIGDGTPYRNVIAGFLGAPEYGNRMGRIYAATNPLTGIATRRAPDHAALAVKIDNVDGARPQTAVDRADIVYEEMVEGRLTRLVAVFHSDVPPVVGPIRSVRTTDFHVLDQLGTPLLAASGANPGVLALVQGADRAGSLVNVNAVRVGSAYFRSSAKRAPHNLFAWVTTLYQAAGGRGGLPPQLFTYRRPGVGPSGGRASAGVDISFGLADIGFRWSATARAWLRTQNGSAHVMADGTRLAPENVVVLQVPYGVSSVDAQSPEAHTVGSGPAWVLTGGRVIAGTWSRARSTDPIALTDGDGDPIALTRGQTFVELAPPGSITLR